MIIPIFVPHEGCPNNCAFCDQHTISGQSGAPSLDDARRTIESHLSTMNGKAQQIAFFGGSFTGIPTEKQNEYLSLAQSYIKNGSVESIRLSTRPDYITDDTVKRLQSYGVQNIELGAQSMDEAVLSAARRGHSAQDVAKASEIILSNGCTLGLQMMTGLPLDTNEKAMHTAQLFKELGALETRIYPTIVISGTHLDEMRKAGQYHAQTVEEAVSLSAQLYEFFTENGIKILRIGLPDSQKLKQSMTDGPYHPAFGELVISRVYRNKIEASLGNKTEAEIFVNPRLISKINGNKRCNIEYFKSKNIILHVKADETQQDFEINTEG